MNIFRTVLKVRFIKPRAEHPGSPYAIVLLGMIWKFVSNRHGEGTWTSGEGIGSWWCKLYGGIKNTHRNLCALCRFWGTQQKTVPHKLSQAVTRDWTYRCLDIKLPYKSSSLPCEYSPSRRRQQLPQVSFSASIFVSSLLLFYFS